MRISWLVGLLASSTAFADAPVPKPVEPYLFLQWETGEQSRDMSLTVTRIEVTGTKLHYSQQYLGRGFLPNPKPVELDATVKDPKKVEAALVALDKIKIKVKPLKQGGDPTRYNLRSGCIQRGKIERCASADGAEKDPDDLKAIAAVRDALLDGVKLPAAIL